MGEYVITIQRLRVLLFIYQQFISLIFYIMMSIIHKQIRKNRRSCSELMQHITYNTPLFSILYSLYCCSRKISGQYFHFSISVYPTFILLILSSILSLIYNFWQIYNLSNSLRHQTLNTLHHLNACFLIILYFENNV